MVKQPCLLDFIILSSQPFCPLPCEATVSRIEPETPMLPVLRGECLEEKRLRTDWPLALG